MSDVEELPWHHEQLVELFGREFAEEVIHPKMEQKQRVDIKGEGHRQPPPILAHAASA